MVDFIRPACCSVEGVYYYYFLVFFIILPLLRVEMKEEVVGKKPLVIDWDVVLNIDEPPPELDVVRDNQTSQNGDFQTIPDHHLDESIHRLANNVNNLSSKLPDKGAKLRIRMQCLEHEKQRRSLLQSQKADDDCRKVRQSRSSSNSGICNGSSSVFQSSQVSLRSEFTSRLSEILEKKSDDCARVRKDAFPKGLSYVYSGECQDARQNGRLIHEEKQSRLVSSRELPFKFLNGDCINKVRRRLSNGGDQKGTAPCSLNHQEESLSGHFSMKRKSSWLQTSLASSTRKGQGHQTVVLVDEEDCHSAETTLQNDQPIGRKKDTKIYYPSRSDPESVELCHSDIDCLDNEAFLSSTIMNFYIRYLRRPVSPTGRSRADYHFFNTYFYKKLKEAILYKKSEKAAFVKFRRWWKGVNVFQKAYILLPIHENQHWSLIIICNPEKDEESGQIILLHLDSLGCHISSEIFENIRSFLEEEWKYLSEEAAPSEPSIGDRVQRNLRDKINERKITVPQQKNDYDCGIFVLYFMERFIEEAPERIKKKDLANLAMFGKQWFKPEEASGLRGRIRELLVEEFENAIMEDLSRETSPDSSGDSPIGNTEVHSDS